MKSAIVASVLIATSAVAAQLTYVGNDGSVGGITIRGVTSNALAGGDFWYNTRWYNQSPLITNTNTAPENVNLYAPCVVHNVWAWNCYYGGWADATQGTGDRIYMSVTLNDNWAGWSAPSEIVGKGDYIDVNDPSVVKYNGSWVMLFTCHGPDVNRSKLGYATSTDGGAWTPSVAAEDHELAISDPNGLIGGADSFARPCLIRKNSQWWVYFDYGPSGGGITGEAIATSSDAVPTNLTVIATIPHDADNWPTLIEPDVWSDGSGQMHALYRKNWEIWSATSSDGISWTNLQPTLRLSWTDPLPYRDNSIVHNPAVVYDRDSNTLYGFMYGFEPASSTGGPTSRAKIDMAFTQYKVFGHSGSTTHGFGYATGRDSFFLCIGNYTDVDRIQVCDSVGQTVLVDLQNISAHPGDIYQFTP